MRLDRTKTCKLYLIHPLDPAGAGVYLGIVGIASKGTAIKARVAKVVETLIWFLRN
jgi:hypothetical protein